MLCFLVDGRLYLQALRKMIELAKDHMTRGSTNEAICLLSHVLEERRGLNGDDDPRTLSAMGLIVSLLHELGRLDQAVVLAREWSVRCRRVFGICHPDTLIASGFTVSLLSELGCDEEAEPIARETHAAATLYHGEDHPDTLVALSHLGVVLRSQGKLAEAEEAMRLEVSRSTQALGTAHPDTLTAQSNLAYTLVTQVQPALHQMEQGSKSLNKVAACISLDAHMTSCCSDHLTHRLVYSPTRYRCYPSPSSLKQRSSSASSLISALLHIPRPTRSHA